MSTAPLQTQAAKPPVAARVTPRGMLLQRSCACGSATASLTDECEDCKRKKLIQTKLTIGAANDGFEREADRVADDVLRRPAPLPLRAAPLQIQRVTGHPSATTGVAPAAIDGVLASPGRPLEAAVRTDMEQRFGHDFSQVRVHADGAAAASARAVNALAYTGGTHVVFGAGQYRPTTPQGHRLLAHELVHTVQQSRLGTPKETGAAESDQHSTSSTSLRPATACEGTLQRQVAPSAPAPSRRVEKIILYKNTNTAEYILTDKDGNQTSETLRLSKHCNPLPGVYTAQVTGGTRRWKPIERIGCALPLNYIIKHSGDEYARLAIADTFTGVSTFAFEVAYASAGDVDTASGGSGGAVEAGATQGTSSQAHATEDDSVDPTMEAIAELPQHIKDFLTSDTGRPLRPADYEIVLRIGQRLEFEGISELELFDLKEKASRARSWADTEASLDRVLEERSSHQRERAQNVADREELEVRLSTGLATLYVNVYRRYYDATKGSKKSAMFAGEAASLRKQLNTALPEYGFRDVAEFEETLAGYLDAFTNETLAIASDLLLKFQYILAREQAKFKSPESPYATRLLSRFGAVREKAQSHYEQAEESATEAALEGVAAILKWENLPSLDGSDKPKPHTRRMKTLQQEVRAQEQRAGGLVETEAVGHDIVSWQDFPRERLVGAPTASAIREVVNLYINEHLVSVSKARDILKTPRGRDRIFELDNLLDISFAAQNIEKDSLEGLVILDHRDDLEREKSATDLLLALIALALAVVVPVGGAVGFVAAGGAFAIGAFQADEMLQAYGENERLYMAQLTSTEPSLTWAVIAVVAAAVDGAAAVKALSTIVAPAARLFNETKDLVRLGQDLAGLEAPVQASILKAARRTAEATERFKGQVKKLKELWTTGGSQLAVAAVPGGRTLARLVAIAYYFLKSRVFKFTFTDYLKVLQEGGVIKDIGKLTAEERKMFRRAFVEAFDRSRKTQLAYGEEIYKQLSDSARAAFTREEVDLISAEGKALGKSEDEIREALESKSLQDEIKATEGAEAEFEPGKMDEVRAEPNMVNVLETVGDSKALGDNMAAAGRPKPGTGYEAHHITPLNEGPEELRQLLKDHALHIDSEFNGVWLPRGKRTPTLSGELPHDFTFRNNPEYIGRLTSNLIRDPALTTEELIDTLRRIADDLGNGRLPPWMR